MIVLQRMIVANILLCALQYTGLMMTTLNHRFAPIWFATGTACGFLFLRGNRILPGIFIGTFFAFYLVHHNIMFSAYVSLLFVLQLLVMQKLCHVFQIPHLILYRTLKFFLFNVIAFLSSGLFVILFFIWPQIHFATTQFIINWQANYMGSVIFAIGILTWDTDFPQEKDHSQQRRLLFTLFLLNILCIALMCSSIRIITIAIALLICLLSIIIAIVFEWRGAAYANFTMGLIVGLGFYLDLPLAVPNTSLPLQGFLIITMLLTLGLATHQNKKNLISSFSKWSLAAYPRS